MLADKYYGLECGRTTQPKRAANEFIFVQRILSLHTQPPDGGVSLQLIYAEHERNESQEEGAKTSSVRMFSFHDKITSKMFDEDLSVMPFILGTCSQVTEQQLNDVAVLRA